MIIDKTKMCCPRFADFLCNRKKRGLSIIPFSTLRSGLFFQLSFRSLDAEDLSHIVGTGTVKVQTRSIVGIRNCPWCGTNLKTFYSCITNSLPTIEIEEDILLNPDKLFPLIDNYEEVSS